MNLSRKQIPQDIEPKSLDYIETDRTSLHRPADKPVYSGKMPTVEDEEEDEEQEVKRERRHRLLPRPVPPHLHDDAPCPPDLAPDMEQAMLVSELSRWLTGDADRERRERLHQSRHDHARRQYYCGAGKHPDSDTNMGSILFRTPPQNNQSSWIASQADMRSPGGAGSKCYVKGYTPRKVTRPQRSHSSLELV